MLTRRHRAIGGCVAFLLAATHCGAVTQVLPEPPTSLAVVSRSAIAGDPARLTMGQRDAKQQLRDALASAIAANINDQSAVTAAGRGITRGVGCIWKQFDATNATDIVREVRAETLDSAEKITAYGAYSKAAEGAVFRRESAPCDRLIPPHTPEETSQ